MSAAASPTIPPCLWTTVCPNCGYSLQGAPPAGNCPECGRAYDQSEVILHGYARGTHETLANAKGSRLIWVFLGSSIWAIWQLFQAWWLSTPSKGDRLLDIAWIAVLLLPVVYHVTRRRASDHPGLVQIRLSSAGCVQYDDIAGHSIFRELWRANLWLLAVIAVVGMLVALRFGELDPIPFWCFFPLTVVALPFCCRSSWRFRRAMRKVREGAIADVNVPLNPPRPWKDVSSYELAPTKGGHHRFKINTEAIFLTFKNSIPVDAEIIATEEQVTELRGMVRRWIDESRTINSLVGILVSDTQ